MCNDSAEFGIFLRQIFKICALLLHVIMTYSLLKNFQVIDNYNLLHYLLSYVYHAQYILVTNGIDSMQLYNILFYYSFEKSMIILISILLKCTCVICLKCTSVTCLKAPVLCV